MTKPIPMLDDRWITERFVRASGPGGQNVNKVATAVELHVDVGRSSLPDPVKRRLAALAGHRMTSDGILQIDSRAFRTQGANRKAARERLAALLARAATAPRPRTATRPTRASKERRIEAKKRRSAAKARRRGSPDD